MPTRSAFPRFLIVCDKFKGSLSSEQVNQALQKGIKNALPEAIIQCLSVSDGGQGLITTLQPVRPFELIQIACRDPLGRPIQAQMAWDPQAKQCLIESAAAIGLQHLKPEEYDLWQSNSGGLGDLIQAALKYKPDKIRIGLGGSATCDGGLGMLDAMGYTFYDAQHQRLKPIAASLSQIQTLVRPEQNLPPIDAICDVLNPPIGPRGGVRVYSPQKGADPASLELLEQGMRHYLSILDPDSSRNLANLFSGGAAGCLGLALHAVLGANLIPGSRWILDALGFDTLLNSFDYVITGEGCIDLSSWDGKITGQIVRQSFKAGKTVLMISGQKAVLAGDISEASLYQLIDYDQAVTTSPGCSQWVLTQIGKDIAETISEKV